MFSLLIPDRPPWAADIIIVEFCLREFACELTSSWPPARWNPGPDQHARSQFRGQTGPAGRVPGDKNLLIFTMNLAHFAGKRVPKSGLRLNGTPSGPPGAQGAPHGPQKCPKMATGSPSDGQRGAQSTPKGAKGRPKSPQKHPRGSQRCHKMAKGSPGRPNYINKLPINRPSGRYVI